MLVGAKNCKIGVLLFMCGPETFNNKWYYNQYIILLGSCHRFWGIQLAMHTSVYILPIVRDIYFCFGFWKEFFLNARPHAIVNSHAEGWLYPVGVEQDLWVFKPVEFAICSQWTHMYFCTLLMWFRPLCLKK